MARPERRWTVRRTTPNAGGTTIHITQALLQTKNNGMETANPRPVAADPRYPSRITRGGVERRISLPRAIHQTISTNTRSVATWTMAYMTNRWGCEVST